MEEQEQEEKQLKRGSTLGLQKMSTIKKLRRLTHVPTKSSIKNLETEFSDIHEDKISESSADQQSTKSHQDRKSEDKKEEPVKPIVD